MAELVIAALMTAVVTYGMSATAKLRSGQAYRAFRAGPGKVTELPPLLAAPPVKTRYATTDV